MNKINKDKLKALELESLRGKYPSMDVRFIPLTDWKDTSANGLTKCIIFWINAMGGQADLVQHLNNCAAKTNDAGWRIIRRKSAGDVTAAISLAMVVSQLTKPQQTHPALQPAPALRRRPARRPVRQ